MVLRRPGCGRRIPLGPRAELLRSRHRAEGHQGRRGALLEGVLAEPARTAARSARHDRGALQGPSEEPLSQAGEGARSRSEARHRPAGAAAGGRRRDEADGAAGAAEHRARRSGADAREGPRGHVVAQAEAAGAVRAGAEQLAARPRSAPQHRQGIVDAGAPEPGDPVPRRPRRTREPAPCSPRSTARRPTST